MDILPGMDGAGDYSSNRGYRNSDGSWGPGERQGPLASRTEQLYACDEYRIFFLTGQPDAATGNNSGISVRPYGGVPPDQLDDIKTKALPWTRDRNHEVTISSDGIVLKLHDGVTARESLFPVAGLDPEVRARLAPQAPSASAAWEKYVAPETDDKLAATSHAVAVSRPLHFKP